LSVQPRTIQCQVLAAIGSKEENFLRIELLFFDVNNVARTYGDDPAENKLLAALKQLQANQYRETQTKFKKSVQRERIIGRFSNQLRNILTAAIKNNYLTEVVST
jgi:hypothetical protein